VPCYLVLVSLTPIEDTEYKTSATLCPQLLTPVIQRKP
jgi:hypothetical protein